MKACWAVGCVILALSVTIVAGAGDDGKKRQGKFDDFFKKLDNDMDGKLTKSEFLRMAERAKEKEQARRKLGQAYDKLDPQKKGITKEVFRRFLENGKNGGRRPPSSK